MVLACGVFDGLHAGHVAYLETAAGFCRDGEMLRVAVAPDAYVRRVKGREPRWPLAERMAVLKALKMVERVEDHDADGVASALEWMRPRLLVKGKDWEGRLADDVLATCYRNRIDVVFVPLVPCRHTSQAFV